MSVRSVCPLCGSSDIVHACLTFMEQLEKVAECNKIVEKDPFFEDNKITSNDNETEDDDNKTDENVVEDNNKITSNDNVVEDDNKITSNDNVVEDDNKITSNDNVVEDDNKITSNDNVVEDYKNGQRITVEESLPANCGLDFTNKIMHSCTYSSRYVVIYLGCSNLDRRFPPEAAMPWVMGEMKRSKDTFKEVQLEVQQATLSAIAYDGKDVTEPVFEHNLHSLSKFAKTHSDPRCFAYLHRQSLHSDFECHVFLAHNEKVVPELFQSIRSAVQMQNHEPLENRKACYEVLYIGRIKIKDKKILSCHIDDFVMQLEAKDNQTKTSNMDLLSDRRRHKSDSSVRHLSIAFDKGKLLENEQKLFQKTVYRSLEFDDYSPTGSSDAIHHPLSGANLEHSGSGDHLSDGHSSTENLSDKLSQSDTGDKLKGTFLELQSHPESEAFKKHDFHDIQMKSANRTMLFKIGTNQISLISLDRETIIERNFKRISSVSQGNLKSHVFGFVSREPDNQLICHLLRCCSSTLVDELMRELRSSFQTSFAQKKQTKKICINCPLQQYHQLCQDINGLSADNSYNLLCNRLQQLPEKDSADLYNSFKKETPQSAEECVELLMIGLRKMCEHKQKEHTHISYSSGKGATKNEFFLVDMKGKSNKSAFDIFRSQAKKKLLDPFESLLTNVQNKAGEVKGALRHRSSTTDADLVPRMSDSFSPCSPNQLTNANTKDNRTFVFPSPPNSPTTARPRSSTIGAIPDTNTMRQYFAQQVEKQKIEEKELVKKQVSGSPMKHMFILANSSSPHHVHSVSGETSSISESHETQEDNIQKKRGSWRQNIFKQVVTPTNTLKASALDEMSEHPDELDRPATKKTHEELKTLWTKAIMETRLLIRMERENRDLRARQDEMHLKRQKLDYAEITPCLKDVTRTWEEMLTMSGRQDFKFDSGKLLNCVKQGVPQSKRGDIWWFLVEQHCLQFPEVESKTPKVDYTELLKQLTTHQHAILIDLGRTFPGHPYFSVQLGNGQLALFNMLKAYSLMDQDVGYCQGLSFVAGILLMHMEEMVAFGAWKHLMYNLGLRKQYRQNMVALQIQLYQLTRLIHDNYKDLYDHFELHEIAPTLYAAPWFLTLFASQFPLGFVARVFDLLFMQGKEVIFKIALVLLGNHKELILQCDSFETVVEFIKMTLPEMGMIQMERVINQVFDLDISKQLQMYEVEYHVLKEEMMYSHQKCDNGAVEKLEKTNNDLKQQNKELLATLQHAHSQLRSQENVIQSYQTQENKFKSHIQTLELERLALLNTVAKLKLVVAADELTLDSGLSTVTPSISESPEDSRKKEF